MSEHKGGSRHLGLLSLTIAQMADPPRFEHGFEAPQAPVISRLHYGSSEPLDLRLGFNSDGRELRECISQYIRHLRILSLPRTSIRLLKSISLVLESLSSLLQRLF